MWTRAELPDLNSAENNADYRNVLKEVLIFPKIE